MFNKVMYLQYEDMFVIKAKMTLNFYIIKLSLLIPLF